VQLKLLVGGKINTFNLHKNIYIYIQYIELKNNMFHQLIKIHSKKLISTSSLFKRNISSDSRIFAKYTIYKNSGALGIAPINPTWKQISGDSYTVEKPGVLLLEFAKARGERQYDWNNKQFFAISVTEMGDMVANLSRGEGVNFFHDSGKIGGGGGDYGGGGGGGNGKAFRADLSPDGNVWFFSLTDKNKDKWLVPVSMGEFVVMRQIMQAAIPSFLGIDKALQQISIDDGESSSSFNNNTFGGNSNYNSNSSSNNNNNNMMSNDDDTSGNNDDSRAGNTSTTGTKSTVGSNWLDQL